MPISEVLLRGSAPNIFMSRAESHDVGGGSPGNDIDGEGGGGLEGRVSKASGTGEGECLSLSLRVIDYWLFGQRSTRNRLVISSFWFVTPYT